MLPFGSDGFVAIRSSFGAMDPPLLPIYITPKVWKIFLLCVYLVRVRTLARWRKRQLAHLAAWPSTREQVLTWCGYQSLYYIPYCRFVLHLFEVFAERPTPSIQACHSPLTTPRLQQAIEHGHFEYHSMRSFPAPSSEEDDTGFDSD